MILQTVNGLRTTCLCFNFSKQSRSSHKQINPLSATSREESQQTLAPSACRQGKTNSARPQHKWSNNQHKHCNVYTCRLNSLHCPHWRWQQQMEAVYRRCVYCWILMCSHLSPSDTNKPTNIFSTQSGICICLQNNSVHRYFIATKATSQTHLMTTCKDTGR